MENSEENMHVDTGVQRVNTLHDCWMVLTCVERNLIVINLLIQHHPAFLFQV